MVVSGGIQAWITSAVDDKTVDKAIVLAGSLRRAKTSRKLAVITTLAVSRDLRERLKEVFDLVAYLELEVPKGLSLSDFAKVQSFSLHLFNKCVYLSPDTLVLKNCDEIFDKYATIAACEKDDGTVDTSVYAFTPSLDWSRALEDIVAYVGKAGERNGTHFSKQFHLWMQNNIPNSKKLPAKYNQFIELKKQLSGEKCMQVDITIANFRENHPLNLTDKDYNINELGVIEKYALERCLQIYMEDVKSNVQTLRSNYVPIHEKYENEPIAVVGLSFRLPGGNNVDEFWDLLSNGKEAIQAVPPHRWNPENICFPCKNRKFQAGFLNVPVDEFDAKFFGLSPKEAIFLDPQQRLLHEVTWEAFEDALVDPMSLSGSRTGVFVGSWVHDYKEIAARSTDVDFFRVYMGNSHAAEAARLSHFLGVTGPSIGTESGCSSAIVALHMACDSLRKKESNLALACGVNLLLHPQDQSILEFVVAPDGRCKTFDADANGFGRAEGCAVLLLKRYSDAIKDGNRIWGLVRGTAVVQEGASKSLGTPTVQCESLAMELALQDANVHPRDVDYIEAHGTGTPVGDPMEIAAIAKAYGANREKILLIGSVKTNVGHTEALSGLTGIIKILLSMRHETIPPHLNLKTINPNINLEAIPAEIPVTPFPWPKRENKPRLAGVSSFGISGTDGHAIIQEAPETERVTLDFKKERPFHIIKISAKCQESLDALLAKYQEIFMENTESKKDSFADIAYSANTGRATFSHRAVLVASNFQEAAKAIQNKSYRQGEIQSNANQLCFLFTGQGSQYPQMAAKLYETSPVFQDSFDRCSQVLQKRYGISIKDVLWSPHANADELSRTLYSQTSIFCVEYCLLKLWESWGVKPDYVMGHSLGEFAAAVAAGALSFDDALMLVAERSRLIDSLSRGKMLVIKADKKTVDQTIAKYKESHPQFWVDFAALNSPDQTVVAGDSVLIEEFSKYCGEKHLKTIVLAATHAFHSRHMDPILEKYRSIARTVKRLPVDENAPKYISGVEGKLVDASDIDADYWVRHTREKVSFIDACIVAQTEGCNLFLEVGPHPVLSALVMLNNERHQQICLPSIRKKEDEWTTLLDSLSKLYISEWKGQIDWKGFDQFYSRRLVSIPFYHFIRKPIWVKIRPPLGELHPLLGKIMPNASGSSVYEQTLTTKKADFALDHMIGNTVVFPGAGFLEMCLAAGHASVQGFGDVFTCPRRPVAIKGLKIKSPLALQDSKVCILQAVVSLDDSEEGEMCYAVNISQLDDSDLSGGGQWVAHASAKFLPVVPTLPSELVSIDWTIESLQEKWEKSDNKHFYEKLPEVGLRFGPRFQSLPTGWMGETGTLVQVKVPSGTESYMIHPVVGDAMLQAAMLWTTKGKAKRKLQVPVHVGEFIWLDASSENPDRYIYCSSKADGVTYALLLDGNNIPLAYMSSIDFAETSVKLVEGMILQQKSNMPQVWEENWRPSVGPTQRQLKLLPAEPPNAELAEKLAFYCLFTKDEEDFCVFTKRLCLSYVIKAMYNLGWDPSKTSRFTVDDLMSALGIQQIFRKYLHFFLKVAAEEYKYLERLNESVFQTTACLPSSDQLSQFINEPPLQKERPEYRYNKNIGENLTDIFSGKVDALTMLFPTDSSKVSTEQFYDAIAQLSYALAKDLYVSYIKPHIQKCIDVTRSESAERPIYRTLEVGAGSGTFTKKFLEIFTTDDEVDLEYHYTDISAAFSSFAEKVFKDRKKSLVFKKFNMEEDPLHQGNCPDYFDFIVACEVLHVAKHLRPMLRRLRSLLKPQGFLEIFETVKSDSKLVFSFGLLEGYWQFEDKDLRPDHISLSADKWRMILEETGFSNIQIFLTEAGLHACILAQASDLTSVQLKPLKNIAPPTFSWILYSDGSEFADALAQRLHAMNRRVHVVHKPVNLCEESSKSLAKASIKEALEDIKELEGVLYLWGLSENERNQTQISLPFLSLTQEILQMEKPTKIFVLTQGAYSINESPVDNPSPGTLSGLTRSIANEHTYLKIHHIDMHPNVNLVQNVDELFYNLWFPQESIMLALRDSKPMCPKISVTKLHNQYLTLPNGCDRYQLVLPESRVISDLEFNYLDQYTLNEHEIEVQVKTMALNFRDVFCVIKPLPIFEEMNTVGLDFAGIVSKVGSKVTNVKVGDRVIGMNGDRNPSLPSHIKVEANRVVHIPSRMTFAEGVTLPAVFATAIYCLLNIAKMKKGDTVLIHTASGGVGLCAIQLAKQVGANVIATAGSPRKRSFLRNLGIEHVFHSRTTDFGKQILEVTNGRGVDIVLNSITGPGFKEASLEALTKSGRFIEMSKLSVWKEEEVKELRPDVFYQIVDLTTLEPEKLHNLFETLKEYIGDASIQPIPYETFDALNIRGALTYLQKAKHIGKIVCSMPDVKVKKGKLTVKTPLFNEDSTYLVTGGLGGIGFAVVKWMLENGAKHVAIASRSAPKEEIANEVEGWNRSGKHVEAFAIDVGKYEDCQSLFEKLKCPERGFPQLRGIMHAAGVLQDATIDNQTWETFQKTYNPKVNGSWNLHDLTKDMLLEHFVLFSSMAAVLGSPGQSNHSASNSFEDAFCAYRRSIGLPCSSVNWGNWGEVGVATEVDFPGVRPISTKQGLLALETFLRRQISQSTVMNVDSFGLFAKVVPMLKSYVEDKRLLGESKLTVHINSDELWAQVDAAPDREGKLEVFKSFIKDTIKILLKMDSDDVVDENAEFQVLGIDSLMMLELKNSLQNVLGSRLTLTAAQLKDCNNITSVASRLVTLLEGDDKDLSKEEVVQLIREDAVLPESICVTEDTSPAKPINEIESILLLGVTGTLGPYLLRDLSRRPQVKRIICLIRPKENTTPAERLKQRLEKLGILGEVDMSKVECIQGDITSAKLGLSETDYQMLAESVDTIVHSAVRSDHTVKYRKTATVRSVNVNGTVNVLELAVAKQLKHLYYASTLLLMGKTDEEGRLLEDWFDLGVVEEYAASPVGYTISKHIAEELMKQALERGIPLKVFRLAGVAGDRRTGRCDFEANHIYLRWLAFMKLGCMPDMLSPLQLMPVNDCSQVSLELFFNTTATSGVYNVTTQQSGMDQHLVEVVKEFDIHVDMVPYSQFLEKLKLEKEDSPLAPFKEMYEAEEKAVNEASDNLQNFDFIKFTEDPDKYFTSGKIARFLPEHKFDTTQVVMKRDLQYMKDQGAFKKFGIKS